MARSTQARIFPAHIRHNAARVRDLAPDARIMACVKANGYGHGIVTVAETLSGHVDGFAVAGIEEALVLRDAGIEETILLLEGPHSADEVGLASQEKLTLCICDWHQLEWIEQHASAPDCWIKIDTGMHRLGFAPSQAAQAVERLHRCGAGKELVLCTHFARADETACDACSSQLACFDKAVAGLAGAHSCANSAAILRMPASHRDWVRPGYMLYGGSPFADTASTDLDLLPAMELRARVISIRSLGEGEAVGYGGRWRARRDSRIATIAAGYGDGYPRLAPDGTPVLIEGRRLPLAGRVSMDMITVDVTEHPGVKVGSSAVLWGADPGIDEIAAFAGTIGYELLAGMPGRVPRINVENEEAAG